jgi:hypothetical protein
VDAGAACLTNAPAQGIATKSTKPQALNIRIAKRLRVARVAIFKHFKAGILCNYEMLGGSQTILVRAFLAGLSVLRLSCGKGRPGMATIEDVKAAEKEMKEAQDALRAYAENGAAGRDVKLHLRLATELKKATDKYFAAVLGSSSK